MEITTIFKECDGKKIARYKLIIHAEKEANPELVFIGLNPSTSAIKKGKLDRTTVRVVNFARRNNFGDVILINPCSYIETKSGNLKKLSTKSYTQSSYLNALHQENLKYISQLVNDHELTFWCGWGDNIDEKYNFHIKKCLLEILKQIISSDHNHKFVKYGELTNNGNPRHPLYLNSNNTFSAFDAETFIKNREKSQKITPEDNF